MHKGACRLFSVTLGPDYDAAHADHFHMDMGPQRACR
ncbi:MAG: extensin family protein [Hyphomonas sp.]